jgi:hypothetical protein
MIILIKLFARVNVGNLTQIIFLNKLDTFPLGSFCDSGLYLGDYLRYISQMNLRGMKDSGITNETSIM